VEFRSSGVVLRKQNYGEADRILRIFTQEMGMVSAIAKGVKKIKSRKGGSLELFSEVNLRLMRKLGELFLITEVASKQHPDFTLPQLAVTYKIAEWILALLPPEKPFPEIYELLQVVFKVIPKTEKLSLVELAFGVKFFNDLGYLRNPEDYKDKIRKLLKFLITAQFREILRLEEDTVTFNEVNRILIGIYETETNKTSRVEINTRGWK
jgi:DNA repair protein RecO (recombination protein O)